MLTLENVGFGYSRHSLLINDFSLRIPEGCVCGLLGKNGVGKSTLLYLICGLLRARTGDIRYNGYNPAERKTGFLQDVFIVPEEFSLPAVSLDDYIAVNAPFYPRFDRRKMLRYLEIFELAPDLNLGQLSMGQKKKAFISFAMACDTGLLLLDEPTNGLDITSKRKFRSAVAECMDERKSIIISTHQVYDVDKIIDHVVIADREGVLLNESVAQIASRLRFRFTPDRRLAESALAAIEVPGGYNIVQNATPDSEETEVNLESLFELTQNLKK